MTIMFCHACGTENSGGNRFCIKCGAAMQATASVGTTNAGANSTGTNYTVSTGSNIPNAAFQFAPPASIYSASPHIGVVNQAQLAGFWPRVGAWLIDYTLLLIVAYILKSLHLGALSVLVSIAYWVGFWSTTGQTVGMLLLHLRVVREDDRPLSLGTGVLRHIGLLISVLAIFIGVLSVIWDPKKQGWHDKIARTVVVRTP